MEKPDAVCARDRRRGARFRGHRRARRLGCLAALVAIVAACGFGSAAERSDAGALRPDRNVPRALAQGLSSGPVAAFSFSEGAGTVVGDSSGHGNSGTTAATSWVRGGKFGNALAFNGRTSLVTIPFSRSLRLRTALTLEAWVDPIRVSPAWRDVIYRARDAFLLEATSQTAHRGSAAGGTFAGHETLVTSPTRLPKNRWSYLAETYDGSRVSLYVNGRPVASAATNGSILSSTSPLEIGGDHFYGQFFAGRIDEVRIYDRALSTGQIQTDMRTPVADLPRAPSKIAASVASPTEIDVSWAALSGPWVTGYLLERCQGVNCSDFVRIAAPTGRKFRDSGLKRRTSYSYRVRAVGAGGKAGPYSDLASGYTGVLVRPGGLALTPGQTMKYTVAVPGSGVAECRLVRGRDRGWLGVVRDDQRPGACTGPRARSAHT